MGKDKGEFLMGYRFLWHLAVVFKLPEYPKSQTNNTTVWRESCGPRDAELNLIICNAKQQNVVYI